VREEVGEDLLTELEGQFQQGEFGLEARWAAGALFEVGPAFVALEVGIAGVVVVVVIDVGEGGGGEVWCDVVVSAVVRACVHGYIPGRLEQLLLSLPLEADEDCALVW
jgi:hypothetical protein